MEKGLSEKLILFSVDKGFLQVDGDGLLHPVGLLEVEVGGGVGVAEGHLQLKSNQK